MTDGLKIEYDDATFSRRNRLHSSKLSEENRRSREMSHNPYVPA